MVNWTRLLDLVQRVLSLLTRGVIVFRSVSAYSLSKVFMLFRTGIGQWIGLTVFVIYESWQGIVDGYYAQSLVPVFAAVGENVGTSYTRLIDAIAAAPVTSGVDSIFLLLTAVTAVAAILWYFKFWQLVARKIQGNDYSPVLVYLFAVLFYGALVYAVTDTVPVLDDLAVLRELPALFDVPGRDFVIDWFIGPESVEPGVNETINMTKE